MSDDTFLEAPNMYDVFEIGGEDLLASVHEAQGLKSEQAQTSTKDRDDVFADIRIRIGTLLKTENLALLLGAGASVDCGGQLIGTVPLTIERALQSEGIDGNSEARIQPWLELFYLAAHYAGGGITIPVTQEAILARRNTLAGEGPEPLPVNFEKVLAQLHRWRAALPKAGGGLRLGGSPTLDTTANDLDACLAHATRALARACDLPIIDKGDALVSYKILVRKFLTRPLNLKRVNVFTLNYDTLVEQASDAEGIVLLDGFVGTQRRVFRPESYEQDLYFPAETTEGRVHRFDRVLHLYKLHGSITWVAREATIDDPYGVISIPFNAMDLQPLLIYPTPAKFGETLGVPYAELFRRFAATLVRPQSVLFVIGYGFGDDHVNAVIRQALAVPSFTLVIVDPNPRNEFVAKLRQQEDRRVWIVSGPTIGRFSGFVDQVLPDLRDEEIRKKVLATHRALAPGPPADGGALDDD